MKYLYSPRSNEKFVELIRVGNMHVTKHIDKHYYNFGLIEDFYGFYWYPVGQCVLNKKDAIDLLKRFIEIDKRYIDDLPSMKQSIKTYQLFIKTIKQDKVYKKDY